MKSIVGLLAVLAFVLPAAASAQALTPAEQATVDRNLVRGRLIYAFDQAAWHATDIALARLPKARQAEVRGWVIEPRGDLQVVTFYGLTGDKPYALFVAEMRKDKAVATREVKADAPRDLTPLQARMAQARTAAARAQVQPCARAPFNTVVIPPAQPVDPVEVYLLTPQLVAGQYPSGGHFLVTVAADGTLTSTRPFTRACLTQAAPRGAAALMLTHLLDPTPTEIHVYLSLWVGLPIFVGVQQPDQLWEVIPTRMRKVAAPAG